MLRFGVLLKCECINANNPCYPIQLFLPILGTRPNWYTVLCLLQGRRGGAWHRGSKFLLRPNTGHWSQQFDLECSFKVVQSTAMLNSAVLSYTPFTRRFRVRPRIIPLSHRTCIPGYGRVNPAYFRWSEWLPFNPAHYPGWITGSAEVNYFLGTL